MTKTYNKLVTMLAAPLFGWMVIAIAAFQSAWMAISSRYPMAFDEAYHYNLIKLHSQTLSPFIFHQPPGFAPYGSLSRDPSQLYHFLLSIPYRIFDAFGASDFVTIVGLRLFSVSLFCLGLILFRRLLLKTKASAAAVQTALLFFVLIPTVPTLAGQLNYDNLQFPLLAIALLLTVSFQEKLKAGKYSLDSYLLIALTCLAGCLNKFTFLPFAAAIAVYTFWLFSRYSKPTWKKSMLKQWHKIALAHRQILVACVVAFSGLFVWFYGVNMVIYRNPVVQCHQVIAPSRCSYFEPWNRNNQLSKSSLRANPNPVRFSIDWVGGMFYRSFFTINGATGPERYTNHVPIPISVAAIILIICGVAILPRYLLQIVKKDQVLIMILFVSLVYVVALWGRNYNDFLHLGQMVAINGRYLHPILLPFILLFIAVYQHAFRLMPGLKMAILVSSLILFSIGGGITGFIHYSNSNWYFEGQQLIVDINNIARKLIAPLFL